MGGGEVTVTTTEKTPSQGNDGDKVQGTNHSHNINSRTIPSYAELLIIRGLLRARCGEVATRCTQYAIRGLCSEDGRLILSVLRTHAKQQVCAGQSEVPVDPAVVMGRVREAGGRVSAMQTFLDAFTLNADDGMEEGAIGER